MNDEIKIIENTEEARHKYAKLGWGHGQVTLNSNHLKALIDGKAVAYFDGEYTHSIVLSQEAKSTPAGTEVEELKNKIEKMEQEITQLKNEIHFLKYHELPSIQKHLNKMEQKKTKVSH